MKNQTITQFFAQFPTDEACLEHLFNVRYGQGHTCPKCERSAKWYRITGRPVYSCQWCGHHTYPMVGTPFESSRTSLRLWFYAIYLFTTTRSGVSAKELQRQLGVTYKCAWRMGQQIREHMGFVDGDGPLGGHVECDETFVGGYRKDGQGGQGKTIVFGMLDRDGDIITKVVADRKRTTLFPLISKHVKRGIVVHTDEHSGYNDVGLAGYWHKRVNHSRKQYVKGDCHTNTIESYWSRLKLSIRGTHIHVSRQHLTKYAAEFEYRFNSRENPAVMLPELLGTFMPVDKK